MKAENEEMRAEFIKAHYQQNPNWVIDAYLWLGERFWFAATQSDYVLWQAAWSASRKGASVSVVELLQSAIACLQAEYTTTEDEDVAIAQANAFLESLLPAEKESDPYTQSLAGEL